MCGIFGYVGTQLACDIVIDALRRMEYRGYDSAGVALIESSGKLIIRRCSGELNNLEKVINFTNSNKLIGTTGLGHTRWATHGRPTNQNAHPHCDKTSKITVVHNGIIENFEFLRIKLEAIGIKFLSETDSEVAVHLMSCQYQKGETAGDFLASVLSILPKLKGHFTLAFANSDYPGTIIAVRRSTPLIIGIGKNEMFLGSDVISFVKHTRTAIEVGQDQVVILTANNYQIVDFFGKDNLHIRNDYRKFYIDWDLEATEKGNYEYFMLKEIAEQPTTVANTLLGHFSNSRIVFDKQNISDQELRNIKKVFIVACGTAYHSGLLAKYIIELWTGIPVEVELASEFRYRNPIIRSTTLLVAISQSGETADTLEAVRLAKTYKAKVLAICNVNGSQIPREADAVLYTKAGPEVGVAATKTFIAQITANYLVGLALAQAQGTKHLDEIEREYRELESMPNLVSQTLSRIESISHLAQKFSSAPTILFLGRNLGYPVALEGALKLKELVYIHAEGFASGELKHGPIALIENDVPVITIMPPSKYMNTLYLKLLSNIREVQARGAVSIVITEKDDSLIHSYADYIIEVPSSSMIFQPLLTIIPLQIFAASIAKKCGFDIDKPRNLAKSVTVE